ncbi:MAG TPA: class IV adenylate cyclase [Anaerolineales bacterium]|nr:class IV adenylate cyclase [Anaerolineales bacterium]
MALETEVKFLLRDLPGLERQLEALGARLVSPEVHEYNLKFDKPDRSLAETFQVLRLRRDARVRLTYKGPGRIVGGVIARTEIEFEAGDFEAAQAFLEALGFEVSLVYEKYRTTYTLDGVEAVLDRTPIGDFAELEGPDGAAIAALAARLGLDWSARSLASYTFLFDEANRALGLEMRDLTFENFEAVAMTPETLGIRPAD